MMLAPKTKTVMLRFTLEKDQPDLEKLAAQHCWSIQNVAACEFVDIKHIPPFAIVGVEPDGLVAIPVGNPGTSKVVRLGDMPPGAVKEVDVELSPHAPIRRPRYYDEIEEFEAAQTEGLKEKPFLQRLKDFLW